MKAVQQAFLDAAIYGEIDIKQQQKGVSQIGEKLGKAR
jgi:hypothetical protein